MNPTIRTAAARLLDRHHRGQPWRTASTNDWTLSGSQANRDVTETAEWEGCSPMDLVNAAQELIAEDQAEYDALE
jgi:hypothetical protein